MFFLLAQNQQLVQHSSHTIRLKIRLKRKPLANITKNQDRLLECARQTTVQDLKFITINSWLNKASQNIYNGYIIVRYDLYLFFHG